MGSSQRRLCDKSMGSVLARFFSAGVLKELARTGHSKVAANLIRHHHVLGDCDDNLSVGEFYDSIFDKLVQGYRHEYVYKNAIAEKILLGRYSLNSAFMLTEFRVDNCKADAVVLNGTSHVYEIKSEMDSYERIDRQLEAYRKVFDCITVVTTEKLYDTICERVPSEIGVMVLAENKYSFKTKNCRREAKTNKSNVVPSIIFESLQRREYTKIIKDVLGKTFDGVPNTKIHKEAKAYFSKIPPEIAHQKMVEVLTNRRQVKNLSEFIFEVPHSLKAASISLRLTKDERNRFIDLMNSKIHNVFV